MSLSNLVFVTSSADKHREAEGILGVSLERVALDLPEPQGLDVFEIARDKARIAFAHLATPVLVEDTALELHALGGFPGPLCRWLLRAAGAPSIARILDGFDDRSATARCVAVVYDGAREWVGEGAVTGMIAAEPRGTNGFGWDVVFAPNWGDGRTYAEMSAAEKNARSHRNLALTALHERLQESPP
jgi:non-canonical purine NTP pyrophosphatase (RdgB/HAM1 family)